MKTPIPLNKPRKELTKLQKEFMKEHSKHHSKPHLDKMKKLMKQGFCIEQAHRLSSNTRQYKNPSK